MLLLGVNQFSFYPPFCTLNKNGKFPLLLRFVVKLVLDSKIKGYWYFNLGKRSFSHLFHRLLDRRIQFLFDFVVEADDLFYQLSAPVEDCSLRNRGVLAENIGCKNIFRVS